MGKINYLERSSRCDKLVSLQNAIFEKVMGKEIRDFKSSALNVEFHLMRGTQISYSELGDKDRIFILTNINGSKNHQEEELKVLENNGEFEYLDNVYYGKFKSSSVLKSMFNDFATLINTASIQIHAPIFISKNMFHDTQYGAWKQRIEEIGLDEAYDEKLDHDALIFEKILEYFKNDILKAIEAKEITIEDMIEIIEENFKSSYLREKENIKSRYNEAMSQIQYYTDQLAIYIKRKEQYSYEYESYDVPEIDKDKIRKDIELIKNDKKVKNVTFNKDGNKNFLVIETNPLIMRGTKNPNDLRYIGESKIKINISPSIVDVRFYTEQKRKGYWSEQDPHPHVSELGNPCLGSASEIIAQLLVSREWYALVTICINFLESYNEDDVAGKNYKYYDKVTINEDGSIEIGKPGSRKDQSRDTDDDDYFTCDDCGDEVDSEDCNLVYADLDDYTNGIQTYVCDNCLNNYYYNETIEAYIPTSIRDIVVDISGIYRDIDDCTAVYVDLDDYVNDNRTYVLNDELDDYEDRQTFHGNIILEASDIRMCFMDGEPYLLEDGDMYITRDGNEVFVFDGNRGEFFEQQGIREGE